MAEYIERDRIVGTLTDIIEDYKEERTFSTDFAATIVDDILSDVVKCQPAADVAPVRHGRWDDSGRYRFPSGSIAVRCSECGCALTVSEYKLNNWNYCPVCGARMDGERKTE